MHQQVFAAQWARHSKAAPHSGQRLFSAWRLMGAKGSRRVGEAERLPCLRLLTSAATRLAQNVAVTPSWKFRPGAGLWRSAVTNAL